MSRREDLQKVILRRLLFYGRTTRPELVSLTGSRAATVFEAIDELKNLGLVVEPERHGKKTGRRAPELECNRNYAYFIGVDLQVDGVVGVVIDSCGDILDRYETRITAPRQHFEDARAEVVHCVRTLRLRLGDKWPLVHGIGFADPGLVDTDRNISLRAVNVPGWENLETGTWLAGEFGISAGVWPEQMVKTRMEYITRLPDAPESLFHLGTDGGIGGGFIKNGKLFVGSTYQGMEIGHVVIDPNGSICSCGNRGCLEAFAGKQGILNLVRQALRNGVDTELSEENFTVRKFVECSHRDKAARIIADEVSESIGEALSTVVALLNPAMIVLSGELAGMGNLLIDAVHRALDLNCFAGAVQNLKLEISALDNDDTARGAALMMRDRLFDIEE